VSWLSRVGFTVACLGLVSALACERKDRPQPAPPASVLPVAAPPASVLAVAPPAPTAVRVDSALATPMPATGEACPAGMAHVPGGSFWVGRATATFEEEENPRFRTALPAFCADVYEVSAKRFEDCVAAGSCSPVTLSNLTCNAVAKGRGDHPANCVDHAQASAFCRASGARLPTEIEWEYLARGGSAMLDYPWGEAEPDGHACWKENRSCAVGSYPAGAFGLYDVVGNVWEWTDSWFGAYPWPNPDGRHRVYRGGSWSRRFEKWMQPTLRNRAPPKETGSHLGFRCVRDLPSAACPYGRDESGCRFNVEGAECLGRKVWNGARCAVRDAPRCADGSREVPGRGCVWNHQPPLVAGELDLSAVRRSRSPKFDVDCRTNQPERPTAYRLEGGEHLARNAVAQQGGCKNRDVGVGWNSVCCP